MNLCWFLNLILLSFLIVFQLLLLLIVQELRRVQRGVGGEIQLTDAIASQLGQGTTYAHRYTGKRFDCGSKQGFLDATVHYAIKAGYKINI